MSRPTEQSLLERNARSAADHAAARLRFLMDAGTRLNASLDLMTTLRTLAGIVVPRLADVCILDLIEDDDRAVRKVVLGADPEQERVPWSLSRRPTVFDAGEQIRETICSGRTFFQPEVTVEQVDREVPDPEANELVRTLRMRSAVIVPLTARRRTLGALTLLLTGPGPAYTGQDRALVEDLARRASLAVDNSRLYTELRGADTAQRFLAEASRALAGSLDWDTTLHTIARLAVAGIADACTIDVIGRRGQLRLTVVEHVDPVKRELVVENDRRYPQMRDHASSRELMLRGEGLLIRRLSDADLVARAVDQEHLRLLQTIGLRSVIRVPMRTDDRLIGTIGLGITESDRRFDAADLAVAADLGRRAGVAADNARLYSDRDRVARTLQDSLMPTRPPAVPHLDVGVRFRPAGDGTELGGDFYDLFEHRPGHWTAVVGDVYGRGAAAAAVTALARHTVRTAARYEPGPAGVLRALHRAVSTQTPTGTFCTAAVVAGRPVPRGCAVRLALGGHPPALVLRAGGRVDTLDPGGRLLGLFDRVEHPETTSLLEPGDALVLYTDGVTEAGAPTHQLGEEWLVATLAELAGRDADTIAAAVARGALAAAGDRPRDDLAVLVLRVAG